MSAETTPADVIELVAKTIHDHWQGAPGLSARPWDGEKGTCAKLPAQAEDFRRKARAVMEALATRPAEPAAPVAEAGDGDVAASLAHLNIGYLYGIADALERTDFTRAGDIRQCLLQVVKGLSASAATLEAERTRADAAEQRAADALARAEKAEGEIAEAERREKWELEQAKINRRHHDAKVHSYVIAELGIIRIKLAEARASREAQPATDGGDNG